MSEKNNIDQEQPAEETQETAPEQASEEASESVEAPQDDQLEKIKETTEKLWGSTVSAFSSATFKATQYTRLMQKKLDLSAMQKKVTTTHTDLGKMIDELRDAGQKSVMTTKAVKDLLSRLDQLKAETAELEAEVEQIKAQEPDQDTTS